MNDWKSVEKNPPMDSELILGWNDHGDYLVGMFVDGYFESNGKIYFIEYWMELPEEPNF